MNNWRIINKIALAFGIVFIVFTALAAIINYEFDRVYYTAAAPAGITDYSILTAILPFLVSAVLSFVVYALISRTIEPEDEKETEEQEKETQQTETKPELEEVFNETP